MSSSRQTAVGREELDGGSSLLGDDGVRLPSAQNVTGDAAIAEVFLASADWQLVSEVSHKTLAHIKHRIAPFRRIIVRILRFRSAGQIVYVIGNKMTPGIAGAIGHALGVVMPKRDQQPIVIGVPVISGELQKRVTAGGAATGGIQIGVRVRVDRVSAGVERTGKNTLVSVT